MLIYIRPPTRTSFKFSTKYSAQFLIPLLVILSYSTHARDFVYISEADETINEGETANIEITRTGTASEKLVVLLEASESRDMVDEDSIPADIVFTVGQTEYELLIPTVNDDTREHTSKLTIEVLPHEDYFTSFSVAGRMREIDILDNDVENQSDVSFSEPHVVDSNPAAEGERWYIAVAHPVGADLDNDGDVDIVSSIQPNGNRIREKLFWYENLGSGDFSEQTLITTAGGKILFSGDVDLDGDIDLVIRGGRTTPFYSLLQNIGNGRFETHTISSGSTHNGVTIADFDGDGYVDMTSITGDVLNFEAGTVTSVIANFRDIADEFLQTQSMLRLHELDRSDRVQGESVDIDNDGDNDLLFSGHFDSELVVFNLENDGTGDFSSPVMIYRQLGNVDDTVWGSNIAPIDIDGDGDIDVTHTRTVLNNNIGQSELGVIENLGAHIWREKVDLDSTQEEARVRQIIVPGDIDGDYDIDLFFHDIRHPSYTRAKWLQNMDGSGMNTRLNDSVFSSTLQSDQDDNPHGLIDLDSDGDLDFLTVVSQGIVWYANESEHGDDHSNVKVDSTLVNALPAWLYGGINYEGDLDTFRISTGKGDLKIYTTSEMDTTGRIYSDDDGELALDDDSGTGVNFLLEASVEAGEYFIEVGGYNDVATGTYRLNIEFVAEPRVTQPSPPRDLIASTDDASSTLSWKPSLEDGGAEITVHEYRMRLMDSEYESWTSIADSAPDAQNATSYKVEGLTNGTAVGFQVRAVNEIGASDASNEVWITPKEL